MTLNDINQFFDTYDKIEPRINKVAHLCTDITSRENIMGFSRDSDNEICIRVWSQDCGNDAYYFPLKYLAMEDDEIAKCEKKKAKEARKRAEMLAREEKKRLERQERREYERLKKKFEKGGVK